MPRSYIPILFLVILSNCSDPPKTVSPIEHITDLKVKEVLGKAIDRAGGWNTFQKTDSIFYKKRTVLFDSTGQVESDVTQLHKYQLKPELAMSITWGNNKGHNEILYKNKKAEKRVNNEKAAADEAALYRTCMSAYYVLFMPFKLLDPGVKLSYAGIKKLPNGKEVHTIAAEYDPEKNANHSTRDSWQYYFDTTNYDFVANMVDHGDYYALIYNDKYIEAGGLRFNSFRPSYRVNEKLEHLWKRGEFYYTDFKLK